MRNQLTIGNLTLETPILLAPMAGYSDLPFRMGIRSFGGVGLAYTEMMNPRSLLQGGGRRRAAMLQTSPEDRPLAHQLYGNDPCLMADAAQWIEQRGAILIDINMGCPQHKIARSGAGAGLLRDPSLALEMARRVVQSVKIPVTAKIRLGWDADNPVAESLARDLEQSGIAAITVHGRTVGQRFTGRADWAHIARVVRAVTRIPVIGNGDIASVQAARDIFDQTGCAGIMLGRGALRHPRLIRDIWADMQGKDTVPPALTRNERVAFVRSHLERNICHYGSGGVVLFRKWIPHYGRWLEISRPHMVRLLRISEADELRGELALLAADGTLAA